MKRPNYRRRRRGVYVHPLVKLLILLLAAGGAFVCVRYYGRLPGETPGSTPVQAAPVPDPLPKTITTPAGAACTLTQLGPEAVHTGNLILVNNWTAFHFPEHQEESLACILDQRTESYYVKDSTVLLLPEALQALNSLMDAFKAQGSRKSVQIVAGHRTTAYQQHLFDQSAERNGLEHAKKYVAQPGHSEHHTGLVVDMGTMNGGGFPGGGKRPEAVPAGNMDGAQPPERDGERPSASPDGGGKNRDFPGNFSGEASSGRSGGGWALLGVSLAVLLAALGVARRFKR